MNKKTVVITTINANTPAIDAFERGMDRSDWGLILVGDIKTPPFRASKATLLDIGSQLKGRWELGRALPVRHYARKNIGYLEAIAANSDWIVDTDDDNFPYQTFWNEPIGRVVGRKLERVGWVNPYAYFSSEEIWPRGLPLEYVRSSIDVAKGEVPKNGEAHCLIQQGLADENPDVDAIYRLTRKLPVKFEENAPLILGAGCWAPFNSQNTTFHSSVAELLYLPSFCSFRMTDIWRSYVAQRILWECGSRVAFQQATVYQKRNEHNLLRDFEDEIAGYKLADKIKISLEAIQLEPGMQSIANNMTRCYTKLVELGAVHSAELGLLNVWLSEVNLARNAVGCQET